jgi:hypothetical protein
LGIASRPCEPPRGLTPKQTRNPQSPLDCFANARNDGLARLLASSPGQVTADSPAHFPAAYRRPFLIAHSPACLIPRTPSQLPCKARSPANSQLPSSLYPSYLFLFTLHSPALLPSRLAAPKSTSLLIAHCSFTHKLAPPDDSPAAYRRLIPHSPTSLIPRTTRQLPRLYPLARTLAQPPRQLPRLYSLARTLDRMPPQPSCKAHSSLLITHCSLLIRLPARYHGTLAAPSRRLIPHC